MLQNVQAKGANNLVKRDRVWKARKTDCEDREDLCGQLIPEEAYNCVNECISKNCYDKVYALNPLEDGEIDFDRNIEFISCLRNEQREKMFADAQERNIVNN